MAVTAFAPTAQAQAAPGDVAYDCAAMALTLRNALRNTPDYGTGATSDGADDMNRTMVAFLFAGAEDAGCTGDLDDSLAVVNTRFDNIRRDFVNRAVQSGLAGAFTGFRAEIDACTASIGAARMDDLRGRVESGQPVCGW